MTYLGFVCRKEATRTPDPYVPNVVRYQLRYFPIAVQNYEHFMKGPNLLHQKLVFMQK